MLDTSTLSKDGGQVSRNSTKSLLDDLLPCYKILILGDPGTGKTSLIHRYISNEFLENTESTIVLDYQMKKMHVTPNDKIILKLWDTAGSEKYSSIAKNYFTNCDGIILCFDITDIQTFNNLSNWINYINNYVEILDTKNDIEENKENVEKEEEEIEDEENRIVIKWFDDEQYKPTLVLTGTKSDIEKEKVNLEEIDKLKKYLNCEFFETSSKNGDGIDDLFFYIAKELFEKKVKTNDNNNKKGGFKLENKRINEEYEDKDGDGFSQSKLSCC